MDRAKRVSVNHIHLKAANLDRAIRVCGDVYLKDADGYGIEPYGDPAPDASPRYSCGGFAILGEPVDVAALLQGAG